MGNKKGLLKSILPWLIVLAALSVAIPFFNQSESSEIRYDKFIKIVQDEKVKEVEIVPQSLVIDVNGTYTQTVKGKEETTKFSVVIPRTETELDSLVSLLDENGTQITVVNEAQRNQFINIILGILPYVLLFAVATMIVYGWGLWRTSRQNQDLANMLSAKGISAVKKALKKKGPLTRKELEPFVKNLTAKQPFMQDSIGVTDPKKFLDSILPYMIKQKMILEERQNGKIFYKIRKD